jgi:predicted transcriptional regulator
MQIIWDLGEVAATEVRDILCEDNPVARETVRTVLRRMEEKGWITHRVIGRTHFYRAAIQETASIGQQVMQLVDTTCGGSPERLVSALPDYGKLSLGELSRIETMLQQAKKQRGRR